MAAIGYQVDEFLEEFVSLAGTRDRKSLRVLDVAAGTGLIGAKVRTSESVSASAFPSFANFQHFNEVFFNASLSLQEGESLFCCVDVF